MNLEMKITELVDAANALTLKAEKIINGATSSIVNFDKSISNDAAFANNGNVVRTQCELKVNVDDAVYKFAENSEVQMPVMTPGTDYAIYATSNGLIASDNFTSPAGYTPVNSRRIGGFHYGDNFIYSRSFWDLKFKPTCDDPRGMVRTYQGFWADIYLLNTTPDLLGTSAFAAQIADGSSPPKKPLIWGGNGVEQFITFTQYIATEVLAAFGKRLPTKHEFSVLAQGSVTGHVSTGDPVKTKFDADARSLIGCEQVSGHLYQWGSETWDRGNGTTGYDWRSVDTDGKGKVNCTGTEGVGASLFGGSWDNAGSTGSRASNWANEPWVSTVLIGARGVCDHLCLL